MSAVLTPTVSTSPWRPALLALGAVLLVLGGLYADTVSSMVGIWYRSETFAHAFLVPPISLWLVWRQRGALVQLTPRPQPWLLLGLAAFASLWLLADLVLVNAAAQFAWVAMLVLAVPAVLGLQVAMTILFPLLFLFFAVPIGEFMTPSMISWTADATIMALRWSGIPVYREGMSFVIPSGSWSVVEACSGVRYLIASFMVGTLFAYLNYRSTKRRLVFVGVSILVPIVANWMRAYMIVILGHLSGNKLAAGVDHLIYGWVFFGIVIMIMFMIGARWSEDPVEPNLAFTPATTTATKTTSAWLAALAVALLAAAGPLGFIAINKADQASEPSLAKLTTPAEWQQSDLLSSWKPVYVNPSAELHTAYRHDDKPVGLYIAYYRNQDYQRKLVTSTNTLASSSNHAWSVIRQGRTEINQAGLPANLRTAQLNGKDTNPETRLLVWQWYWINGKLTASDFEAKLLTAFSRLRGRGDDSAVIILYANQESASETLPTFAMQAIGPINQMLDATRAAR